MSSNLFAYKKRESSPQKSIPKFEDLILESNKAAMEYLRQGNFNHALNFLRQAEKILLQEYQTNPNDNTYRLIGITLNNLGCYYKRTGKFKVSLRYLKKALQIEIYTLNDKTNIAGTHLNICAILSAMNQHSEAISHVKLALELLEMAKSQSQVSAEIESNPEEKQRYSTILTTMIIAYYNYGTELEYVKEYESALQAFSRGFNIAMNEYGPSHPLANTLQQNIAQLNQKKQESEKKDSIKQYHLLKNFEANKYIRVMHKNQNLDMEEKKPIEKSLEYGYDGHRKMVPKPNIPQISKRGYSTPKYLPPINGGEKNPLVPKQDYGNVSYHRSINRISREKKLIDSSDMNKSMFSEDKRSQNSFITSKGKINQSFSNDKSSILNESLVKARAEKIEDSTNFQNELKHEDSNLLGGPNSKIKNGKRVIADPSFRDTPDIDTPKSPTTEKNGKKTKINFGDKDIVNFYEKEKESNLNELWNNIQKYRGQNSSKSLATETPSAKQSQKLIEKKELPQLIEMSPEKTMSDEA